MQPKFKEDDYVAYKGKKYKIVMLTYVSFNSQYAYTLSYDEGYEYVIVLEDDLKPYRQRGFERLSSITQDIKLPERATAKSAGYDISVIHPLVYKNLSTGKSLQELFDELKPKEKIVCSDVKGVIKLPTGIKAYMLDDEVLSVHVRSSLGIKQGYTLANGTGIIDSDYYNNPDNEGHIIVALKGVFFEFTAPVMRVAQGIFEKYLIIDDDNATNNRNGGIGSTDGN